jgi:hypothetical protein
MAGDMMRAMGASQDEINEMTIGMAALGDYQDIESLNFKYEEAKKIHDSKIGSAKEVHDKALLAASQAHQALEPLQLEITNTKKALVEALKGNVLSLISINQNYWSFDQEGHLIVDDNKLYNFYVGVGGGKEQVDFAFDQAKTTIYEAEKIYLDALKNFQEAAKKSKDADAEEERTYKVYEETKKNEDETLKLIQVEIDKRKERVRKSGFGG